MAGKFAPGQQQSFDDYYQKYSLARWTEVKNITNLPAWRKTLRNSHLGKRSAAPEVHDHLNALVLDFMSKLAAGPYHPAVQVNAMLMIGELNSVEQPPTPLPEALDVMIAAVQDTKLSDAVRVAAMVGIQRHVAAGIADAEVRRTLTAALLKLAAADLPAGADRAGREWIRCQSIETLGTPRFAGREQRRLQVHGQHRRRRQAFLLHPRDRGRIAGTIELCRRGGDQCGGNGGRARPVPHRRLHRGTAEGQGCRPRLGRQLQGECSSV